MREEGEREGEREGGREGSGEREGEKEEGVVGREDRRKGGGREGE